MISKETATKLAALHNEVAAIHTAMAVWLSGDIGGRSVTTEELAVTTRQRTRLLEKKREMMLVALDGLGALLLEKALTPPPKAPNN